MQDKESIFLRQKIDCNCSDCKHLLRNNYKKKLSDQFHEKLDKNEFNRNREKDLFIAYTFRDKALLNKAIKQKLTINYSDINFGYCKKFDLKEISFIPNTCQLETQECFEHRRNSPNT